MKQQKHPREGAYHLQGFTAALFKQGHRPLACSAFHAPRVGLWVLAPAPADAVVPLHPVRSPRC